MDSLKPSRILLRSHRVQLVEKNSRFIGIGCISQSLNEFKLQKAILEQEFADANHVTFAHRILDNDSLHVRFCDAGEPSGTAGKPILMHLEGQQLLNVSLFVVRYFGGIKLGAGGLMRAYGQTARLWVLGAETAPYVIYKTTWITLPYSEQKQLEYLARKHSIEIHQREYSASVACQLISPEGEWLAFVEQWPSTWEIQDR